MILRHKLQGYEVTINSTTYDAYGTKFFAFNEMRGFHHAGDYELVPEARWRDITRELSASSDTTTLYHPARHGNECAIGGMLLDEYRFKIVEIDGNRALIVEMEERQS